MATISFARGAPSLDIVDVDGLKAAADQAFATDPAGLTGYGTSIGYPPLREWIAAQHDVAPEHVLVTNGSMQADAFLFDALVQPGDVVIVERPTYDRTLLSLRSRGADVRMVELEPDGIDVAALERVLATGAQPKLAHIIPNFQNPAGYTLSLAKRERLLELARQHEFIVFEDDPYVALRFEGEQLPRMQVDGRRPRRVRLLLLQDGLSRDPGRLPRRTGGADRADRQTRDQHVHLSEHGRPGDRPPVLRLRRADALDRNRPGRAQATGRHAVRGTRARAPRRSLRQAGRRILPVGGSAATAPT